MKKSDFDRLLDRYLSGEVSDSERINIEAWLDAMKTRGAGDLELSKDDEDELFRRISGNLQEGGEIGAFRPEKGKKYSPGRWLAGIAAALLVVCLVSYGVWQTGTGPADRLQTVSARGIEKVILSDGTLVWLQAGSKLSYYEKQNEGIRFARLEGEALFEVAKDASHPFVIECGNAMVRVLGTSFNIRTGRDSLEVSVLTGHVNLSSTADTTGVDIAPNEKAIYTLHGGVKKSSMETTEVSVLTANTEYNMEFTNATMETVMKRIGAKFNVMINLDNEKVGGCRITADFTDRSLESSLQMIGEVLKIAYRRKGNTITVTGAGCQ